MANFFFVPIELDALPLNPGQTVVGPTARFTGVPYFANDAAPDDDERHRDFNPSRPNVFSEVDANAFSDENLFLPPGVHLHWALPDGLTKGTHHHGTAPDGSEDRIVYPITPNRWMVVRSISPDGNAWTVERTWMVESDFITSQAVENGHGPALSPTFPVADPHPSGHGRPFRFLGRKLEFGTPFRTGQLQVSTNAEFEYEVLLDARFDGGNESISVPDDLPFRDQNGNLKTDEADGSDLHRRSIANLFRLFEASSLSVTVDVAFNDSMEATELRLRSGSAAIKVPSYTQRPPEHYLPSVNEPLTANGFGDPTFDAFYPNCVGVYGMHDDRIVDNSMQTRYEVFGWYNDAANDPLLQFIEAFEAKSDDEIRATLNRHATGPDDQPLPLLVKPETDDTSLEEEQYHQAFGLYLKERFGWSLNDELSFRVRKEGSGDTRTLNVQVGSESLDFQGLICYSRLTLDEGGDRVPEDLEGLITPLAQTESTSSTPEVFNSIGSAVAVGNTGAEALARWLAQEIEPASPLDAKKIEAQLTAINLAPKLQGNSVDLGQKFKENRHTSGFRPIQGETFWTLRPASHSNTGPTDVANQDDVVFPAALSQALSDLNAMQKAYEQSSYRIQALRQTLFTHWHHYMRTLYVPADDDARIEGHISDEIRHFIGQNDIPALQLERERRGTLQISHDALTQSATARALDGQTDSLAGLTVQRLQDVIGELDAFNSLRFAEKKPLFHLQRTPGPRFYQPNEPVVLLVDPLMKPTTRHGQDGRLSNGALSCTIQEIDLTRDAVDSNVVTPLIEILDDLDPGSEAAVGFETQINRPWNPFMLQWEGLVDPLTPADFAADPDNPPPHFPIPAGFIKDNPALREAVLGQNHDPKTVVGSDQTTRPIRGKTILNPHPLKLLKGQLEAYIEKRQQEEGFEIDVAFNTAQMALAQLNAPEFHGLAQSLGGFNKALLMCTPSEQLLAADPFGAADPEAFPAYREFAMQVRDALGGTDGLDTPESEYDFNPLRAGDMILKRLKVVDTFGQKIDWIPAEALTSVSFNARADRVGLPVRITQPSRLNFRWLNATSGRQESGDSTETTPICGWFLANHLDRSVMVYNTQGTLLGYIDQTGRWRQTPGTEAGPMRPDDINNPNLSRVVKWITDQRDTNPDIVAEFITMLETVLPTIEPENFEQHHATSLFVGRPIALVRARINLELRNPPARNVSDAQFERELDGHPPTSHNFPAVEFPIRLGDLDQFNDSVIAYWLEQGNELVTLTPDEVTATSDKADDLNVWRPTIWQSLEEPPQVVSMLMDPRGCAHASTGILPTKAITIPAEQFAGILKAIQVTFQSTPVLTPPNETRMPLPTLPGFSWEWLQKDDAQWKTIPAVPTIDRVVIVRAFPADGATIWERMDEQNWIRIHASGRQAQVLPPENGVRESLGAELAPLEADIARVLEESVYAIRPVHLDAHFAPSVEIREGWLSMRRAENIE